ncbi:MAG TPA: molybdopterin-dependent oxidoreductase, partial [Kribbella sp.]|nr:molybdopterin-dependent oxidoreductase [Kribbella sp.]
AYELVADRLTAIQQEHGRNSVGVYLGNPNVHSLGALTHMPTMVRQLHTRNKFSATSIDQLPQMLASYLLYGHQLMVAVPDIDRTSYLLMLGANPLASNGSMMTAPGFGKRLQELRKRGGRLVVVDPRRTETAAVADEHHFVRPGTDAAFLLAVIHEVIAQGFARTAEYVDGFAAVEDAVQPWTSERAADVTGIPADVIRRTAREFAEADRAACYGRVGVSTQQFGAICQWAIQVLNIITGNLDRPGGTMFPRPAVNTLVGMGRGHVGVWTSRVRGLPEFGGELPVATMADEILTPGDGQIKAMVTVAGNPVLSTPDGRRLDEALDSLDFMVAIDPYINETTRHADVILPPAPPLERDHYDIVFHQLAVRNTARWNDAVLPKPASSRHDWEIFRDLGLALVRRTPWGRRRAAVTARLRTPPRWIVDTGLRIGPYRLSLGKLRRSPGGVDLGPLQPALPGALQQKSKRIDLAQRMILDDLPRLDTLAPVADDELLLIGRRHLRNNNSWMHNSERLVKGRPRHHLLMHPDDLTDRCLTDGQLVTVTSAAGSIAVEVAASNDIMPGVVSLPHGFGHNRPGARLTVANQVPGPSANDITDPHLTDHIAGTAAVNGVPVTVTPA